MCSDSCEFYAEGKETNTLEFRTICERGENLAELDLKRKPMKSLFVFTFHLILHSIYRMDGTSGVNYCSEAPLEKSTP